MNRQKDDGTSNVSSLESPDGLESAEPRYLNINNHHIGLQFLSRGHQRRTIADLPDDIKFRLQDPGHGVQNGWIPIGQQNSRCVHEVSLPVNPLTLAGRFKIQMSKTKGAGSRRGSLPSELVSVHI